MDLSVIVATYNRPELLAMVCGMLRRQKGASVQIVVVDDGSARPAFPVADADVYLWRRDEGFCKARCINEGLALAGAPAVAILDDDAVPRGNGWARGHLSVLERAPASRGPFDIVEVDEKWGAPVYELKRRTLFRNGSGPAEGSCRRGVDAPETGAAAGAAD